MRLILFDVDGTLVDSQHEIVEAQARAFAAVGLPAPPRAVALSVVGLSLREAFTLLVGADGPVDRLSEAYKDAWGDLRRRPDHADVLYPGAREVIADLASRADVRLGIATGKSRRGVHAVLAAHGWDGLFGTIQTADDHPSKPDPAMILAALAETGVASRETAMIGDTSFDMLMARAAGVRAIGVGWGYHSRDALRAAGAEIVVDTFTALRDVLDRSVNEAA